MVQTAGLGTGAVPRKGAAGPLKLPAAEGLDSVPTATATSGLLVVVPTSATPYLVELRFRVRRNVHRTDPARRQTRVRRRRVMAGEVLKIRVLRPTGGLDQGTRPDRRAPRRVKGRRRPDRRLSAVAPPLEAQQAAFEANPIPVVASRPKAVVL